LVGTDAAVEDDGRRWRHLSISRSDRTMPSWDDQRLVCDVFAGSEAVALHILPARREHVCHLWVCLDGRPVPDFWLGRVGVL
jgi:hypothetical protein